jgi:aminoglycoside N3'-acetyltransferase
MAATRRELTKDAIVAQLRSLGVRPGSVLLVHASFRAVRPVENGPVGLIEALREALGPDGTLVMPSWTGSDNEPFDPLTTPASRDLGVLADTFWRMPDVKRSDHPFAFAALGPHSAHIVSDLLPLPPHRAESPVGRVRELDGQVLLIGVGQDANTTLHLAELLAGVSYRMQKHIKVMREGKPTRIAYAENDHCCERFALVDDWLRPRGLIAEGQVGHADARLSRARDIVGVTVEHLRRDPLLFLHPPDAGCAECDAARASVSNK